MRSKTLALIAALCLGATGASASVFTIAGLQARGPAENFEVFVRAGRGSEDYFCAAGDYAKRALGARASDRIVITRGLGPSPTVGNRLSIGFSVQATAARSQGIDQLFLRLRQPGANRSVAFANHLCNGLRESFGGSH